MTDVGGPDSAIVTAECITKSFGGKVALDGVSFRIQPGTCFGLLGPNGAGKTTLLRILTDIIRPDSGTVRVLGSPAGSVKARVGYLPEERGLYRKQRVGDVLAYLGRLKDLSNSDAARRVEDVLAAVGMREHINARIDSLSKGMAQRIQLAAALINDPEFVIFDEPFSGLDPVSSDDTAALLKSEALRGRTVLLSTHQMPQAERLCTDILMLNRGKVVLSGSLTEVLSSHRTRSLVVHHQGALPPLPGMVFQQLATGVSRVTGPSASRGDEIARALMTSDACVTAFSEEAPSLEEIFIRKVRDAS